MRRLGEKSSDGKRRSMNPAGLLGFDSRGPETRRAYAALAMALLGWIADRRQVPMVVVKGAASELSGLRGPQSFSDVDILLLPTRLRLVREELERRGWVVRPFEDRDNVFPKHSLLMYHPQWPIDIDLHYRFPGFEAAPELVLDEVLRDAIPISVEPPTAAEAAVVDPVEPHRVLIPSRLAATVFQALHQLRSPWETGAHAALERLNERSADLDTEQLLAFAQRTGALAALRPFLELRGGVEKVAFPEPSTEWVVRTLGENSASIRIFRVLRAPWRHKPRLFRQALFPSRRALAALDLSIEAEQPQLLRVYLQRLRRFAGSLPATVRSVRQLLVAAPKSGSGNGTRPTDIDNSERNNHRAH